MEQTLDDRVIVRSLNRTTFKMLQALPPPVKRWIFRRMGEE
jgi:hypothetical protein